MGTSSNESSLLRRHTPVALAELSGSVRYCGHRPSLATPLSRSEARVLHHIVSPRLLLLSSSSTALSNNYPRNSSGDVQTSHPGYAQARCLALLVIVSR